MSEIHLNCVHCGKPIFEGEDHVTVTVMKERFENGATTVVGIAEQVVQWHTECAPAAMARHELLRDYQSHF